MYYCGIDLGGTNIAVGLIDDSAKLIDKISSPTPKDERNDTLINRMAELFNEICHKNNIPAKSVSAIGIGVPGQPEISTGNVGFLCNLHLRDIPIGSELSRITGLPVFVCNDADAAAFGEAKAGSGKGYNTSVTVTIGTGIGTGIILGSEVIPSEGGHIVIRHNGWSCNCGRNGCFEAYASTNGLIKQVKNAMTEYKDSLLWKCAETLDDVNGKTVFDAMDMGDETAKFVYSQYLSYLADGLASICNLYFPDVICLGGGICAQGDRLLNPLIDLVSKEQYPLPNGKKTKLTICSLGNDAGIIGAALYGKYHI